MAVAEQLVGPLGLGSLFKGIFGAKVAAKAATKTSGETATKALAEACVCCFVPGTPVLTDSGMVPIEQISIGTLVQSRDEATGRTELKPVIAVIRSEGRELYGLTFLDERGRATRIESSDNHPFWVLGRGWVDSAKLERGMKVSTYENGALTVVNVEDLKRKALTFNLTVADFHTFFAGESKAFVHNAGCCAAAAIQGHHALPKFLGGDAKQVLSNIDSTVHVELHSALRQNLKEMGFPLNVGGRGGSAADWARYMNANPGAQRQAFDAVLDASRAVDARNGTEITQGVWRNIMNDRFTSFP